MDLESYFYPRSQDMTKVQLLYMELGVNEQITGIFVYRLE